MRTNILLLIFVIWNEGVSCANEACGSTEITITGEMKELQLPVESQAFKQNDDCIFTVTTDTKEDFKMTIPSITFLPECTKQFVGAATTKEGLKSTEYKKCGTDPVTDPILSSSGTLFVEVKTLDVSNSPKVTLKFEKVSKTSECGNPVVQLSSDQETLQLPVKPAMFTTKSNCIIEIKGFQGQDFEMTIPSIHFLTDCAKQFVAAAATKEGLTSTEYKKCGTTAVTDPIQSVLGTLFVQVKTLDVTNNPTVTLQFDKVRKTSECGNPVLQLSSNHETLQLPVAPGTFTTRSDCIIEVKGIQGKDFEMTIPSINFLPDCSKQFVAAATTKDGLATAQYKKCGTTAVTDPIKSASGTLFVQVKTTTVTNTPTVTLEFNKGYQLTSHLTLLLFALLTVSNF